MIKRSFDLFFAIFLLLILALPIIVVAVFIKLTSKGPTLYWSKRIGLNSEIFVMPKFRTMRIDTPQVASHLLTDAHQYLIPGGWIIRKLSLDELPQFYSVLRGDMSFVGPRPALYNQDDLIQIRKARGIDALLPGITGWAQINGRDEISLDKKVKFDEYYLKHQSFSLDLKIIFLTIVKVVWMKDISH